MYLNYYGLKEKPFNITIDPNFLFYSRTHKEAFSHILYGIKERKGFIAITGEIGAGKTTLCRALLNQFDEETKTAYVFNPSLTGLQLLQVIVEDFGMKPEGKDKISLFRQLNKFLLNELTHGHNVLLIIDEAQNMRNDLLEEVRMLSNLETEKEKLFQIILIGQPELRDKLNSPDLTQLRQRISVRFHISPLQREEITYYIYHRLKVAGSEGNIDFSQDALDRIFLFSNGIPRLINVVCDRALLHGYVKDSKIIDGDIIKKSIAEIDGIK